jgi:hypothetical protein
MMKLTVAIAILSVFFIGQTRVLAQDSESAKKPEIKDTQVSDSPKKAEAKEKGPDGSRERDARKDQLEEQMSERKAELREAAGNDPAMKEEIQAKLAEEKKMHKQEMKARSREEKEGQNSGLKANEDGLQSKTPATATEGQSGVGVSSSDDAGISSEKSTTPKDATDRQAEKKEAKKEAKKESKKEAKKESKKEAKKESKKESNAKSGEEKDARE